MTRREWMIEHHPECVAERHGGTNKIPFRGGCIGCPSDYPDLPGTEDRCDPKKDCEACWTREVPDTGKEEKRKLEIALRAVHIAAIIMKADGLCTGDTPCSKRERAPKYCEHCIETWLLSKAKQELREAENAEILSDLKDID